MLGSGLAKVPFEDVAIGQAVFLEEIAVDIFHREVESPEIALVLVAGVFLNRVQDA